MIEILWRAPLWFLLTGFAFAWGALFNSPKTVRWAWAKAILLWPWYLLEKLLPRRLQPPILYEIERWKR